VQFHWRLPPFYLSLAIGDAIAGVQSMLTGHRFWQGFSESIQENWVDALITSFAFTAVSVAASNILKCFQCFKEGTLVETEDGLKPIEEIEVGDKVLAYDEETGEQAYKEVVRLFRNTTEEWYHIHVNGEEIVCTGGHPFYLANLDKFIPARELKVGASLLLSTGTCAIIEAIQIEQLSKPETTYIFEVADFHTYYVTDSKVLVHNTCKPESPVKLSKSEIKKFDAELYKEGYVDKMGSRFDIFKDTANSNKIWLGDKSQRIWIETNEFLQDLFDGRW